MAILDTLYISDCIQSRLYSLYKIMEMLSETNQHCKGGGGMNDRMFDRVLNIKINKRENRYLL